MSLQIGKAKSAKPYFAKGQKVVFPAFFKVR